MLVIKKAENNMLVDETVGSDFNSDLLIAARDKTLAVINEAFKFLTPGISEDNLKTKIERIQKSHGIEKRWHPPQIRFGKNTTLPFGVPGIKNNTLQEDDILFIDLGLIYKDHEGDVGRPTIIGNNSEKRKCCDDAKLIWFEVRDYWQSTGATGKELYDFATKRALFHGWDLCLKKANGHRISDFPHATRIRGSI